MTVSALWPYAHVADVQRSLDFYARLGLRETNRHEVDGRLAWAFALDAKERAGIMLALASGPVAATEQAVLFYCWADDVHALRDALRAEGVDVGPVEHRPYMPAGEIRLEDPDGYVVLVGQLGPA